MQWEEVERLCKILASKIDYKPDIIIALARGGLVPARLLCDLLLIKDVLTLKVNHWGITANKDKSANISYSASHNLNEKKVLIIDDITDTGESLKVAINFVKQNMKPLELKTATLCHISHSCIKPDFYAKEILAEKWTWIIWPWNFYEDMKNILQDFEIKDKKNFVKEFNKRFDSNLTIEFLEKALNYKL
ncbi:MAG: phosphoribosyltransferase [Candidatus Nanoarchaeia archaeon]